LATSDQFSVIILDRPSQAQRAAVQARIKKVTQSWWHEYDDVWMVRSATTPSEWIDRLQPVFKTGNASFLVLGLPGADEARTWAYFGPDPTKRLAWLHRYYTKDTR